MNYAFISHSSEDQDLAESLAQRLGKKNVFFDKWNLSSGRLLASDIAKGVFGSSWFIIIASKNAAKSMRLRLRPQSLPKPFPIDMWIKCLT